MRVSTLKKSKPQGTNNSSTQIITTNTSELLRHAETEGNSGHKRMEPAPPPPIFVGGITHMQRLTDTIEQVVNRLSYTLKIINNDTIKIIRKKLEYHKTITDIVKEKKKLNSTHTNLGNNVRTEW
jgi:hypothetical protein